MYNAKTYEVSVLETKPAAAISVIECDLNVDFAPPVGYQEGHHGRTGGAGSGGNGVGPGTSGADEAGTQFNALEMSPDT